MHRLRTADQWVREGRYAEAQQLLRQMAQDHPESLLLQQRIATAARLAGDGVALDEATAAVERLRERRAAEGLASPAGTASPGVLIVDPIFRGSRLYYTAMLAEALGGVADASVQVLTRRDLESDLLDSYRDRLASADLDASLGVDPGLWYGRVGATVCGQIVARIQSMPPGSFVALAGWNELLPDFATALVGAGRHFPVHVAGYEYSMASLREPAKRAQLSQMAGCVDSLTVWLLDESSDLPSLQLPGVQLRIMPDPIPHHTDAPAMVQARQQRSAFVDKAVGQGQRSFLAVGLQSARKGLRDIIRAARKMQEQQLPARILLSGQVAPGEEELEPQVRSLAAVIASRAEYVSDEEILRTYASCDAVLLPYARDFSGSSGVFAHAMAFGKPVIATSHGCVGWRTKTFGLGLTYEANDPDGLLAVLQQMLGWSEQTWQEYRLRCNDYYRRNSYEATLAALRAQAQQALGAARSAAPAAWTVDPASTTADALPVSLRASRDREEASSGHAFDLRSVDSIRQICLLDTGVGSRNMGDHIIVDSIRRQLRQVFPAAIFVNVPTHEYLGTEALKLLDSSDIRLVCGTNLLASHMDEYKQWKIGGLEFAALREVTLMGCGWWQYQEAPNRYTELLLNRVLSGRTLHSVRDSYTAAKLEVLQGKSVVNTTCPTLWSLTPQHLAQVPDRMARDVVTTLTDYKADPAVDGFMLDHLQKRYRTVYVWIQGTGDYQYLKRLVPGDPGRVRVVPATLEAYDDLLSSNLDLDYVGTRLHAGVRALQKKRRALILAVDNRAREISADTALPCVPRERAPDELEALIGSFSARGIRLPTQAINRWIDQFR